MADEIPDLWPEDFGDTTVATPLSVLRIQAKALAARTDGLLEGQVKTEGAGQLSHRLTIYAPALGYTYLLLTVRHDVNLYPLALENHAINATGNASDALQFESLLGEALGNEKVIQIIRGLIAQSVEASE